MKGSADKAFQRARERNNPLRGFDIQRAVHLAESFPRGEFADLMWTLGAPYNGIETADADLSAIISRRCSALAEMDWNAKAKTGDNVDPGLAAEQVAAVREMVDNIDNLYAAIDHLALAFNRGFAHCEIVESIDGTPIALDPVDQWHVVRDGIYGEWKYNPDARQVTFDGCDGEIMPVDRFVLREVKRPVGRIALMKFTRSNLAETDWAAFTEIYGARTGVVEMPPGIPQEQEAEYLALAEAVAQGGSGAIPSGSKYFPNSGDKGSGSEPFDKILKYLSERLVLVGTNGKLTMLAESGSGTLGGNAHADTFDSLSRSDARDVSEDITSQLVTPFLKKRFPGRPILAKWELAFREEVDSAAVVQDAATLSGAGYTMDAAELGEKTGYNLRITENGSGEDRETVARPLRGVSEPSLTNRGVMSPEKQPEALKNDSTEKLKIGDDEKSSATNAEISELLKPLSEGALAGSFDAWREVFAEAMTEGLSEEEDTEETEEKES